MKSGEQFLIPDNAILECMAQYKVLINWKYKGKWLPRGFLRWILRQSPPGTVVVMYYRRRETIFNSVQCNTKVHGTIQILINWQYIWKWLPRGFLRWILIKGPPGTVAVMYYQLWETIFSYSGKKIQFPTMQYQSARHNTKSLTDNSYDND